VKRINTSEKQINTNLSLGIHHKKLFIQNISILGHCDGGNFFILIPMLILLCKWLLLGVLCQDLSINGS